MSKITKFLKIIGMLLLFVLFALISVNIVLRYFFSRPIFWAEELTNFLFIWFSFIAAIYAISKGSHVRVTVFVNLLPQKIQTILSIIINIVLVITCFAFIVPTLKVLPALNISSAMRIPEKYVFVIIPLFFILCTIYVVINILKLFNKKNKGGRAV